jgi:fatty-acyl-CoA synthase
LITEPAPVGQRAAGVLPGAASPGWIPDVQMGSSMIEAMSMAMVDRRPQGERGKSAAMRSDGRTLNGTGKADSMIPTPTVNRSLPLRVSGFRCLADGLDYAADGETGCNFYTARGVLERVLPYRELRAQARNRARRLAGLAFARGTRVALVAETSADFLIGFFACQYAGLIPVPLPLSVNFGGSEAYEERLRVMMQRADARVALASNELIAALQKAAAGTDVALVITHDQLQALPADPGDLRGLQPDEPCYIQFSSGSTSLPRGVLVTQRSMAENAAAIAVHGIRLQPGDRCVSWLPLYHDMGLVGCCLTPVLTQTTVDYLPTTAFARRPLTWLKLMSDNRGTISYSPTFGYELCVRRAASRPETVEFDLSAWRVAGIGGEMIRPNVLQDFANEFERAGFDGKAFVPSYGLAEATLAVTFAGPEQGVRVDWVEYGAAFERDRRAEPALLGGQQGRARAFAICGRPMAGYRVEVRGDDDSVLPERRVGRVCIKGPSLMQGYFRDLKATRSVTTADGWLDSGDLGYMVDGELVITGRSKDLIIFNGRNIWPQDLEWAVEKLDMVRAGDVAAFSVSAADGSERVMLMVECRSTNPVVQDEMRQAVRATVQRVASVDCEVVLAPPRSLTFTSSGKLSRAAAKGNYLRGVISDIAAAIEPTPLQVYAVAS